MMVAPMSSVEPLDPPNGNLVPATAFSGPGEPDDSPGYRRTATPPTPNQCSVTVTLKGAGTDPTGTWVFLLET